MSSDRSLKGKGYSLISCNQAVEASKVSKIYGGGIKDISRLFSTPVFNPYTGTMYNRTIKSISPTSGMMSQLSTGGFMNIFGNKNR